MSSYAPSALGSAIPAPPIDESAPGEDYANPLQNGPRWALSARAYALRSGATLAFGMMNLSSPSPNKTIWLDSTLGEWKGKDKIRVDIWDPEPPKRAKLQRLKTPFPSITPTSPKRPAIINFHGGGFILGNGTDDQLWAATVMKACGAVVLSVNYRLAPEYPYPTPVEDCADAILQICRRSEELGIDPDQIILSGFSAGATLSLASWVLLQTPQRWGYQFLGVPPKLLGFALFYPSLDWTVTRPNKRLACANPDNTLPKGMTDLFDASYIWPPIPRSERSDPRLSPGLMTDDLLHRLPPVNLCLCEYDMLLAEGQRFAERLKAQGKEVSVRVVEKEKHGWDKTPTLFAKQNIKVEYAHAINVLTGWLDREKSSRLNVKL
ncbi:Alpha/Beta hydrolase protein [Pseudomassariella vexata]|uniref:Alpha/Beta hydrolase protein n=1 Tax=Pseudomassariella vexata TaxID=1141098 RepID=A0A1Y2E0U3_9PEZI|nr:Alpha/Beta hydrolase protein [Pseudomassariella vexata]ORY64964.1 Alpha/Beta hydrolase protein [Pseudomassariella vexata]